MYEAAGAIGPRARLWGFCCSARVAGLQAGQVLVRSVQVTLPYRVASVSGRRRQREVAQHLLEADDLTQDKLRNRQPDDFGDGTPRRRRRGAPPCSSGRQAPHQTEDDLVTIDDIDIEMDGNTRSIPTP